MMLGRLPKTEDSRDFQFKKLTLVKNLPELPPEFGHDKMISDWQMYGNDRLGNCVWAGAAHETRAWGIEAGKRILFRDEDIINDYSAGAGYNPADPSTDRGTIVRDALKYRAKTGILDAAGVRRKILAYVALTPGDVDELLMAMFLFGAVGMGFNFPNSAMDQFEAGRIWKVVKNSSVEGGHYVPGMGYYGGHIWGITWGRRQPMTKDFYRKYCDEAWALVSLDMLKDGKTLEGFDLPQLKSMLTELTGTPVEPGIPSLL